MPVAAAAEIIGITDQRLWRIVHHHVSQAFEGIDLSNVEAIALDETAAKRGHRYVTVFIDLDRAEKPVIFACPGKGKETVKAFRKHLQTHGGKGKNVREVVCDMSPAFLAAVRENLPNASVTVDWFHIVQMFNKAVDNVRKNERKYVRMPKAARWAVLKGFDGGRLTARQAAALAELEAGDYLTATAWRIKEKLRWVRQAESPRAAAWRLSHFIRHARDKIGTGPLFAPMARAIDTVEKHKEFILRRWHSKHSNARLEGLNSIFQAARTRARGYRNVQTFITIIYLLAAPLHFLFHST